MDLFNMIDQFSRELDQIVSSVASDTTPYSSSHALPRSAATTDSAAFDSFVGHVAILDQDDDDSDDDPTVAPPLSHEVAPVVRPINIDPIALTVNTTDIHLVEIATSAPSTPNVGGMSSSSRPDSRDNRVISLESDDDDDDEEAAPSQHATTGWGGWLSAASNKIKDGTSSYLPRENARYLSFVRKAGATEVSINAFSQTKIPFLIEKNKPIIWKVCIKDYDIRFSINLRLQEDGGSIEREMEPQTQLKSSDNILIGFRRACDVDRYLLLVFDNSYSKLRSKTCAYKVIVGPGAAREIEDFVLEQEEAAKDWAMDSSLGEQTTSPPGLLPSAAYVGMSLFKNMIANAKINVSSFLATPVKSNNNSSSISNTYDDVQCVDISAFLCRDDGDGSPAVRLDDAYEEEAFVHSPLPAAALTKTINVTERQRVDTAGFIITRNALTSPESFEQLWINYFGSAHTLTIFVRPTPDVEVGFPTHTLCSHLEGCGVFNIAKGLIPMGVKLYS